MPKKKRWAAKEKAAKDKAAKEKAAEKAAAKKKAAKQKADDLPDDPSEDDFSASDDASSSQEEYREPRPAMVQICIRVLSFVSRCTAIVYSEYCVLLLLIDRKIRKTETPIPKTRTPIRPHPRYNNRMA